MSAPIEFERHVRADPEDVFACFTDPDLMVKWQGTSARLDARPGGEYRIDFGPDAAILGRYVVVEKPTRLVYTWGWRIPPGGALSDVPPGSSTIEVTFQPDGDGTIVRVRHTGLPGPAQLVVQWGWDTYLDRLQQWLSGDANLIDPALERIESLRSPSPQGAAAEDEAARRPLA